MNNDLLDYLLKSLLILPHADRTPKNVRNVLNLAAEAVGGTPLPPGEVTITPNQAATLIRIEEVSKIVGLARSTLYKFLSDPDHDFPRPVKLSAATAKDAPVAWVLAEVQQWARSRLAFRCEFEPRKETRA